MKIDKAKIRTTSPELETSTKLKRRVSLFQEGFREEIIQIDINRLIPYKNQARVIFDENEIKNLSDSIKTHGIRQPLTVIKSLQVQGNFEVISGERRLRAAKKIGLDKVPCIILQEEEHVDEIALIENIQREDLHPLELARSLKSIISKKGWGGQSQISQALGLPRTKVNELLPLADLPLKVQDLLLKVDCRSRDNFRKLLSLKTDEEKINFLKQKDRKGRYLSETKRGSIFRVYLDENVFKIQKKPINKLLPDQKAKLKNILEEIIKEL